MTGVGDTLRRRARLCRCRGCGGFASAWYGDYVSQPWRKRSTVEIKQVLESHGLTGPFWSVE